MNSAINDFPKVAKLQKRAKKPPFRKLDRIPVEAPKIVSEAILANGTIEFTVHHKPMGAPRMTRRDKWLQRPCVMAYREFKDAINRDCPPIPHPHRILSLSWIAFFVPPPSWSAKRRAAALGGLHRSKPDRDNIDKAILDALFAEDSAIALGTIEKRYGIEACVKIKIVYGDEK